MVASRYELRGSQWERIKDVLPGRKEHVRCTAENHRKFVNGFCGYFAAECAGATSRALRKLQERLQAVRAPVSIGGKRIFHELVRSRKDQYLMIISTLERADQQAATGRKKGADNAPVHTQGGLTTKVY